MQKQFRQFDAHTPSSREVTSGTLEISVFKAQSQQHFLHIFFKVCEVDGIKLLAHRSHFLNECHILFALIVSARHQLLVKLLNFPLHLLEMLKGQTRLFKNGASIFGEQVLRQVSNDRIFRRAHPTLRGLSFTCKNFQERTFSRSVFPHQSDAVFLIDLKRNIFEKGCPPKFYGESVY